MNIWLVVENRDFELKIHIIRIESKPAKKKRYKANKSGTRTVKNWMKYK